MAAKYLFLVFVTLITNFSGQVESASLIEKSYEYVMNLGKSLAPNFMSLMDCLGEDDFWTCAKEKAGKMLDSAEEQNNKQRQLWQEAADAEMSSSGRAFDKPPSKLGIEVEESLRSVADLMQNGVARALSRKHGESGGGIDSITISTGGSDKKKKKMKKKPAKIQLVSPVMVMGKDEDRGLKVQSLVIGKQLENDSSKVAMDDEHGKDSVKAVKDDTDIEMDANIGKDVGIVKDGKFREARNVLTDLWGLGDKAVDALAEHAIKSENLENEIADKSSVAENRGKKKKKKKAILKLLILGAVLKAKIGTLLQILSFKLQVKFFIIALIGLAINLARFWIDLKNKHQQQQPQKVIYYEHAQHQHHYDHEEEPQGWGPWSRSMDPELHEETEIDADTNNSPFRAQIERNTQIFNRLSRSRV